MFWYIIFAFILFLGFIQCLVHREGMMEEMLNVLARLMSRHLCLGQCLCLRIKCLDSITE